MAKQYIIPSVESVPMLAAAGTMQSVSSGGGISGTGGDGDGSGSGSMTPSRLVMP